MKFFILVIALGFVSCKTQDESSRESKTEKRFTVKKFTGQEKVISELESSLYDLELHYQLIPNNESGCRFFLVSGKKCLQCDENHSLYLFRQKYEKLIEEIGNYSAPGKEFYWETNEMIWEGEVYFGEVLESKYGVIVFQKALLESKAWESSVLLVECFSNGNFTDDFLEPIINRNITETLLKNGQNFQIERFDRTSEP